MKKIQGGLRPGVSLEPTKESVIRILRAQAESHKHKKGERKEESKILLRTVVQL